MNKQETKELLEFAGVDITKGKAKALIEAASDKVTCPDCGGKGGYKQKHGAEDEWDHCPTCDGKKVVTQQQADNYDNTTNEGWGASAQKRQQEEMADEGKKYRKQIQDENPEALKAYDAWVKLGKRGKYAAKDAIAKGMPK